jgi:hypothetical protein
MKLTVIFEDGSIIIDGEARAGFDLSGLPPEYRALQWDSEKGSGWIELAVAGEPISLSDPAAVDPFVALHQARLSEEAAAAAALQSAPPTNSMVNQERDRRTHAGFVFQGKLYQFDPDSRSRITGAAALAKFAIVKGVQPGNLRWINPAVDFSWIAADNTLTLMDAHTCSAFGDAAAVHEQRHIFAARAIKAMDPIPADYATNNAYWPA